MATSTLVPVEEYLSTSYEPDAEYVDGQVLERTGGEYDHSRLLTVILMALHALERTHRLRVFPLVRIRVLETPERKRYCVPDVCVMRTPYTRQPVLTESPVLVVEILSPDDRVRDTLARIADFSRFGVKYIYFADPEQRKLFRADEQGLHEVEDRRIKVEAEGDYPGFEVDVAPLFAQLDE